MRVLVLGATGMLGSATLRVFASSSGFDAFGTVRGPSAVERLPAALRGRVIAGIDALDDHALADAFARTQPELVINCIGVIKQLAGADDPLEAIPVNALLPHRLSRLCEVHGARLVQVSTDCVFSGAKGRYVEGDPPDATDLYGRSKLLGEVDAPHAITLRTSVIGHELGTRNALVEWFLAQRSRCLGYSKAVFSGLPTVTFAEAIRDAVVPRPGLRGLYHVAAAPIAKRTLLELIARVYSKRIEIVPDDGIEIDRSLDSTRFRAATGWVPGDWPTLVQRMHDSR